MSKFTAGTWKYFQSLGVVYSEDTSAVIANVQGAGTGSCFCLTQEGQANARLIAAAPKMYELLKEELIPISDYGGILSFAREAKIRAVLDSIDGKETKDDCD